MTIKALYPNIAPSLLLDFANVENLDPRITFARASTARYYNGVTTAKAEENLLLWSQDFEQTGWLLTASTLAANNQTAPDGTTTADTLTFAGGGASCRISRNITASALDTTRSIFVKAGTTSFVQFLSSGDATAFANFDVSTGTVGTVGSGVTASTVSVGSGWYRLVMTFAKAAPTEFRLQGIDSNTAAYGATLTTGGTVFLWGAQLEQRSAVTAYTPTTTQPITNYVPVLLSAANNVARFDHNPVTGESLGLLIEEQRTNLILRSEEFDNASWTKARATITANTVVAPDGTLTGDKLVANTDSNTHNLQQGATVVASSTNTVSVYMKAGEYTWGSITVNNGSTFPSGYYNLATGVVGSFVSGASGSIQSVGNGWYRCTMTFTMASGTTPTIFIVIAEDDNDQIFAGNGFSGLYIWGAQLEAGAFPTSYIPTVASQVTRSVDVASMTGANFSSWYNQAEGSFYADYMLGSQAASRGVLDANDSVNPGSNLVGMRYASGGQAQYQVAAGGVNQANLPPLGFNTNGASYKRAIAYATNSFNQAINGALPDAEDTSGITPVVNVLRIGSENASVNQLCGHIRKLAYYPKRLANAELQALTQI